MEDIKMAGKQTRAEYLGPFLAAASTPAAIRTRIALIGLERGLPQAEVDNALAADLETLEGGGAILRLVADHNISLDWLIMGDLRGLQRMRRPASTW
jgi:hypothetical protein